MNCCSGAGGGPGTALVIDEPDNTSGDDKKTTRNAMMHPRLKLPIEEVMDKEGAVRRARKTMRRSYTMNIVI